MLYEAGARGAPKLDSADEVAGALKQKIAASREEPWKTEKSLH